MNAKTQTRRLAVLINARNALHVFGYKSWPIGGLLLKVGRESKTWGLGDVATWGRVDVGTCGRGDVWTWGRGDVWTWGRGDAGTWGRGDAGTQGGFTVRALGTE